MPNRYRRCLWFAAVVALLACLMGCNVIPCPASEHFKVSEFKCRCCGKVVLDNKLTQQLEKLRAELGNTSIVITSGYRCPKHNKEVRGAPRSQHCLGKAADIKVKHYTPQEVGYFAKMVGFSYVKVYKSWVHVDVR